MTREQRRFLLGSFALALALRALFLVVWQWKALAPVFGRDLYYELALGWLGWGPRFAVDATHPPLYTAFIAVVLKIFRGPAPLPVLLGTSFPLPVLCAQTALSAGVAPLVYALAGRLTSERAARLAALWVAADPTLIVFAPQLQSETLFIVMEVLFFCWLYRRLLDEPRAGEYCGLGFLGGLISLCRSEFAAFPPFLFLALWRRPKPGRAKLLLSLALFSAGWFAPISAWTARNWRKYHRLIPISGQMGWTLYEGFTLDREDVRGKLERMGAEAASLGITDPIEGGRYFQAKTLRFIRENPGESLKIVAGKAFLYWRPWAYDPYPLLVRIAIGAYFLTVFPLALLGAWAHRRRALDWLPIYALFGYLTLLHSIFFTSLRYRMPLEPFLCLLAAAGLDRLIGKRLSTRLP